MSRRSRFLLIALFLHVPLFVYPVMRLCSWLDLPLPVSFAILFPVFFSQLFARKFLYERDGYWVFALRNLADLILGLAFLLLIALLLFELPVAFAWLEAKHAAGVILFLMLIIIVYGGWKAWRPVVVKIDLHSPKLRSAIRFVQISDVHIGSRSIRFLNQLLRQVEDLGPDFLCITGDFIDQPGITRAQLSRLESLPFPVFYCTGNHERYEDLEDILYRLRSLGVQVLNNAAVQVDDQLQIIGIDDRDDALQVAKQLPHIPLRADCYQILLYHRPLGLEACQAHGVDLMLSGHTHGGQIMPFNLLVRKVFSRTRGLFHFQGATLYVSEGTGTWGPFMRLGTRSEITLFTVKP